MEYFFPKLVLISILLFSPFLSDGQNEDLTKDEAFFQHQAILYGQWLEQSGFAGRLSVHSVAVKPQKLSLYLAFPFENADSVFMAWEQMKQDFEDKSSLTLEKQLFYKMLHFMDIPAPLGNIQLFNTYDVNVLNPCFKRAVYFKNDSVRVAADNCKSVIRQIDFDSLDFAAFRLPAVYDCSAEGEALTSEDLKEKLSQPVVFYRIEQYARDYFQNKKCADKAPKVVVLNDKEELRFEVRNLCKEVLPPGFIWDKKERLTFIITYAETKKGFHLSCEIDGRYASGFFSQVRRDAYEMMDFDFKGELTGYAEEFRDNIRQLLRDSLK